jgi:hypothetical protein
MNDDTSKPNLARPDMPALLEQLLQAIALETAAWTEALEQIADRNSPARTAIHKHIDTLVDTEARLEAAGAAVNQDIAQSTAATWHAIEADLGFEKVLEIKRLIDDLRLR